VTEPVSISFHATDIEAIASAEGTVAVIIGEAGKLDTAARRVTG
jgi:leucyl aminopeptidase